ncbi:unnamed protein product, partial [Owenia fusiformis]
FILVVFQKGNISGRTTKILIQFLAIADCTCLISFFVTSTLRAISSYTNWFDPYMGMYAIAYRYTWTLYDTTRLWSTLCVLAITVERYVATCYPFKVKGMFTPLRVKIASVAILIFVIGFNLPKLFDSRPVRFDLCTNSWVIYGGYGVYMQINGFAYAMIYLTLAYYAINCVVPLLCLIIMNARIVFTIRKSIGGGGLSLGKSDDIKAREKSKERTTTIMFSVVVVVFIICQTWPFGISVTYMLDSWGVPGPNYGSRTYLYVIGSLLLTINSSVNFLIYLIFSQRFRETLVQLICCGFLRGKGSETSTEMTQSSQLD